MMKTINWTDGLSPEEIEMYKKMRAKQQAAKQKGVKGQLDLILEDLENESN